MCVVHRRGTLVDVDPAAAAGHATLDRRHDLLHAQPFREIGLDAALPARIAAEQVADLDHLQIVDAEPVPGRRAERRVVGMLRARRGWCGSRAGRRDRRRW